MERILQCLVKIIIVGALLKNSTVLCNPPYLRMPQLPYGPASGPNYYVPEYASPHRETVPVYYDEDVPPHPIHFQNRNYFSPSQPFYQNNYQMQRVPHFEPDDQMQPFPEMPAMTPYEDHYQPPSLMPLMPPRRNQGPVLKYHQPPKPPAIHPNYQNEQASHHLMQSHSSNSLQNDERYHNPNYSDEYNKNYHEEDYVDNYGDEGAPESDPCGINSPYRYFQPRIDLNNPDEIKRQSLCNPNFQAHVVNAAYDLKTPITLLPSRFPPRVEQVIERIQNYFSTYTQQGLPKPQNQTGPNITNQPSPTTTASKPSLSTTNKPLPTTTSHPSTTIGESSPIAVVQSENLSKNNLTYENKTVGETTLTQIESTTVSASKNVANATEKAEEVTTEAKKEISLPAETDVQTNKELKMNVNISFNEMKKEVLTTAEVTTGGSFANVSDQQSTDSKPEQLETFTRISTGNLNEVLTNKSSESNAVAENTTSQGLLPSNEETTNSTDLDGNTEVVETVESKTEENKTEMSVNVTTSKPNQESVSNG